MTWLAAAGLASIAGAVILAPGLAIATVFRFRTILRWALALVFGIGAQGLAAAAAEALHVPWTWITAVIAALLWILLAVVVMWLSRRIRCEPPPTRRNVGWRPLLAAAFGFAVSTIVFALTIAIPSGSATNIAQAYDTMFHFDLVQWILQHQDAAATRIGAMDGSANASTFYPDAWHTVVAFLVATTGSSIPLAASAMAILITIVIWPLSLMAFAAELFGYRPLVLGTAGALSGAATAFPWHLFDWGPLYPNALSLALMPAVLALIVRVSAGAHRWESRRVAAIASIPLALVALMVAQPNTLFTAAVALLPLAVQLSWRFGGRWGHGASVITTTTFVLLFAAGWTALYELPVLRRTVTWPYSTETSLPRAAGKVLLSGYEGNLGQLLVPVLSLVGILAIFITWRHAGWFVGAYGIVAAIYVIGDAVDSPVRQLITGFWYNDQRRLAANAAILGVVLAVGGTVWLIERLPRLSARPFGLGLRSALAGSTVLAVVLLNLLVPAHRAERVALQMVYTGEPMLSGAALAFLARVRATIGDAGVVANDPADGSGFGYSLDGLDLLFPTMIGNWLGGWSDDTMLISEHLDEIATRPDVCAAAQRLDLRYVLDLDSHPYYDTEDQPAWQGLRISSSTPGFTAILIDGERGLYRIDGC